MVKSFDQQLLKQLKTRDYSVQEIEITDDEKKNDDFFKRIDKIETQGLDRNRTYYEFVDDKKEFEEAKNLFQNKNSLALSDGLITETGNVKLICHLQYNYRI